SDATRKAFSSLAASERHPAAELELGRNRRNGLGIRTPLVRGNGHGVGQCDRHWIALLIIDAELVMQMRTRRPPGLANIADDIALFDMRSNVDAAGECRQMRVSRRVGAPVLQDDDIAVTVLLTRKGHAAVARRVNRRAG